MRTLAALLAAALLPAAVSAQEQSATRNPPAYKVEFNIHDGGNGAGAVARHYTLLTDSGRKAVLKVGNRVPVATGSFQPGVGGVGVNPLVNTQYTYLDVGVNIECVVSEVNGRIALHGNLDLSSIQQHEAAAPAAVAPNPTVGQTKLELDSVLDPGKTTAIASIDDPSNMRKFEVDVTVTRTN